MIPHTSTDELLRRYGNTPTGRAAARARLGRQIATGAAVEIAQAGRSIRCGQGDHRRADPDGRMTYGCRNDGANCLCECHDAQVGGDR